MLKPPSILMGVFCYIYLYKKKTMNWDKDLILTILGSNLVTTISGFFIGKRKNRAEEDNIVLNNLEKSIILYSSIIQSLKAEIKELNEKINSMEVKIETLHKENLELRKMI